MRYGHRVGRVDRSRCPDHRRGKRPRGVSSDGTHVWVANPGGDTVTELDASTGAVVQTTGVGYNPLGVSSDGTHVWVANSRATRSPSWMRRPGPSSRPSVWAALPGRLLGRHPRLGDEQAEDSVTELDASTVRSARRSPSATSPGDVSSHGTHVWVTNTLGNTADRDRHRQRSDPDYDHLAARCHRRPALSSSSRRWVAPRPIRSTNTDRREWAFSREACHSPGVGSSQARRSKPVPSSSWSSALT